MAGVQARGLALATFGFVVVHGVVLRSVADNLGLTGMNTQGTPHTHHTHTTQVHTRLHSYAWGLSTLRMVLLQRRCACVEHEQDLYGADFVMPQPGAIGVLLLLK